MKEMQPCDTARSQAGVQHVFLAGISTVYAMAFLSLYLQLPGLFGASGLIPAYAQLERQRVSNNFIENFKSYPTESTLPSCLCNNVVLLFFPVSSWTNLFALSGFLAVLVAPFWRFQKQSHLGGDIMLGLVRWLLFRLMFLSGIVKLTSECPTWWGLTALNVHYESQCIPTPLAWYAHQLPHWFHAFSVVQVYIIEIVLPFGFFLPFAGIRIACALAQIILMALIFITGNYNFFNILTSILAVSVLYDDELWIIGASMAARIYGIKDGLRLIYKLPPVIEAIVFVFACLTVIGLSIVAFGLRLGDSHTPIVTKILFSKEDFAGTLTIGFECGVVLGVLGVFIPVLTAMIKVLRRHRFGEFLSITWRAAFALFLVSASIETLRWNDKQSRFHDIPRYDLIRQSENILRPWNVVNSYGLFRRMTGVGGRPEVSIEGSEDGVTWYEYVFKYKPGDTFASPLFVAPHQPRLDWQMWFAALGSIESNPWLQHFAVRLLEGEPAVLRLLSLKQPEGLRGRHPKMIRMRHWTYHFTKFNTTSPTTQPGLKLSSSESLPWWRREVRPRLYLVPIGFDSHQNPINILRRALKNGRTMPDPVIDDEFCQQTVVCRLLRYVRFIFQQGDDRTIYRPQFITHYLYSVPEAYIDLQMVSRRKTARGAAPASRSASSSSLTSTSPACAAATADGAVHDHGDQSPQGPSARQSKTSNSAVAFIAKKKKIQLEKRSSNHDLQILLESDPVLKRLGDHNRFFSDMIALIPPQFYLPQADEEHEARIASRYVKNKGNAAPKQGIKEQSRKAKRSQQHSTTEDGEDENENGDKQQAPQPKNNIPDDDRPSHQRKRAHLISNTEALSPHELRAKLAEKLREMRESRNAPTEPPQREKQKKHKKKKDTKQSKNLVRQSSTSQGLENKKDGALSDGSSANAKAAPITFSKLEFATNDTKTKKKKARPNPKQLLEKVEREQQKLEQLRGVDTAKAEEIEQKQNWSKALKRAQGEKVFDNPKLVKKTIKTIERQKKRSKKKWEDRQATVEKDIRDRQEKRERNLKTRIEKRKDARIKKIQKKRPGFTGK
eukprot:gene10128-2294_t